MQTTLSGTLYVYQGEELGQRNMPPSFEPSEYKDIETINYWEKVQPPPFNTTTTYHPLTLLTHQMKAAYPDNEEKLAFARKVMQRKARDHARTPVQWTSESPNAGFCDPATKPWMRVNDDYKTVNAAAQRQHNDPDSLSVLQFWKRGLAARKKHKDALVYGDFHLLDPEDGHDQIFAYARRGEEEGFVTVLNFRGRALSGSCLLRRMCRGGLRAITLLVRRMLLRRARSR
jgi:glycosidase